MFFFFVKVSSFPEVASEQQTDTNSFQKLDIDTSDIESPAYSPWHPMKSQQEKQTEKTVNCAKYTDLLPINYCSNIESVILIILLLSIKVSPSSKVPENRTNQQKIEAKIQLVHTRLKEKYKIPKKQRYRI